MLARTEEGRRELEAFGGCPVPTDTRVDKEASGEEGANRANARFLRQMAVRDGVPILDIRAAHNRNDGVSEKEVKAMREDEFKGLSNSLQLCVGARVLLTQNIYVEAGLMNGALGVVKGFVFPKNFDPNSSNSALNKPSCVIVKFDELRLPEDLKLKGAGLENCVPIFYQESAHESESKTTRKQFPLTLAWCLTHWKAQGMTLSKVKIALGEKVAKSLGVGYTAASRVKHVRDLVFSPDLPDYEVFQNAKHTAAFRSRQRFELKLEARASETILNYASKRKDVRVKCEADVWEEKEAGLALELIDELRNFASRRRAQFRNQGRPNDENAWLWGNEGPNLRFRLFL